MVQRAGCCPLTVFLFLALTPFFVLSSLAVSQVNPWTGQAWRLAFERLLLAADLQFTFLISSLLSNVYVFFPRKESAFDCEAHMCAAWHGR